MWSKKTYVILFVGWMGLFFPAQMLWGQCGSIDFTASETLVCAPRQITFYSQNVPAGSSITWDFGAGPVPGKDTSQHIFTSGGTYTITLKVTFSDGVTVCTVTKPSYITVFTAPTPFFTVSRKVLCNGIDSVTITDKSTGGTSRRWTVEGLLLNDSSPQITYPFTTTGPKSIVIAVSSANCPAEYYKQDTAVMIYDSLRFDFSADSVKGCTPATVTFTANVTTPGHTISQYDWSFPGGNPSSSTLAQPSVQYTAPGQYAVLLKLTNTDGCTQTVSKPNYLVFGEGANFSVTPSKRSGCRGETFVLDITPPGLQGTFTWDYGAADVQPGSTPTSQRIIFTDTGYSTIRVTREYNGCNHVLTYTSLIYITPPLADFIVLNSLECDSNAKVYVFNRARIDPAFKHTYLWRLYGPSGNVEATSTDSIPNFNTTKNAVYSLELVVRSTNLCSDSIFKKDVISRRPGRATLNVNPPVSCIGKSVEFSSGSPPFSSAEPNVHEWTIFDKDGVTVLKFQNSGALPRINYSFNDTGTYKVRMRVYNSKCDDTREVFVRIVKPTHSIIVSDLFPCVKNTITLGVTSQPPASPLSYAYTWELQNAIDNTIKYTATGQNTSVTPTEPGPYDLKLTADWANGCTDVLVQPAYIKVSGAKFTISFTNPDGCVPLTGNATSTLVNNYNYKNPGNTAIVYTWLTDPQPGVAITSPAAASTQITFNQRGEYKLGLTTMNGSGCRDTAFYSPIYAGVMAGFSANKKAFCVGDTIATANTAKLTPQTYSWFTMPVGPVFLPSASTPAPNIYFPDSGIYTIYQVVSKNGLCYDTMKLDVNSVRTIADFSSADTLKYCSPLTVMFNNLSTHADTLIWLPGDGNRVKSPSTSQFPYIYFKNSGPQGFDVKLIARNNLGCVDSITRLSYIVILGPVPSFSLDKDVGCNPLAVTFTDNSKYYNQYFFDYGDGSKFDSTGNPGTHLYANTDMLNEVTVYKPKLYLIDSLGCIAELQYGQGIKVNNPPVLKFSADSITGCVPLTVTFRDSSLFIKKYSWDFDNDGIEDSNNPKPSHTYTTGGTYSVRLKGTSQFGCTAEDTLVNIIQTFPSPIAGFNVNRIDNDTTNIFYDFINQSLSYNTLAWYVDTQFVESIPKFTYVFKDTGKHFIRLIAINAKGCSDTADSILYVIPDYFFHIPNAFTPDGNGLNEKFGLVAPIWPRKFIMRIYNRYGQMLFETDDIRKHWDGTFEGIPVQQGVYVYSIEYLDIYSHWNIFNGTVVLLR